MSKVNVLNSKTKRIPMSCFEDRSQNLRRLHNVIRAKQLVQLGIFIKCLLENNKRVCF